METNLHDRDDVEVESEERSGATTTSSDSDVEGESLFCAMPCTRWSVEVAPSFSKRTYGVSQTVERMRKCAKLDEQLLDGLRALLPHSARWQRRERNDPSVVMDAYRYIVELQQEVKELTAEILEREADSSDEEPPDFKSRRGEVSVQQPLVEVMRRDGLMEVRIACANRPGLLVDVMEAVETRGLSITQARIACQRDSNASFKYLSSENEQYSATISLSTEGGTGEELDNLKAILVGAICEGSFM